ncbi:NACHT domain-containing protein [Fusarium keratoplasticum]|uniref:NACHT domain-containing protein n=1 Tax=Fusarium keratoplasticum TaxID=1328300 RepID=A0ACC0QWI9_9HYPO|nr:NACHT domain-containing protein [Fusarium keratoplasticum]KAI8668628.1 NACHT domain-containing protein [Fusarium keratoplasticum]
MSAAGSSRIQIGNNPTIHHTTNNYSQDGDAKYLAALCSTDPRHDKIRIEQTNGGLLKDSYRWVLQNPDYQRWRDPAGSWPLLWIRGDAGKGKTMLLSGIIDELQSFTRFADPTSHTSLSYFFCQATNPGLNNATAVLRGLVYLLVDQQRCLLSHVRDKTSIGPEHWNSGVAIRDILSKILEDPALRNTILVVDALDECVTDLEFLLQVVISTSSPKVRWLVSSRNISEIEQHLGQAQTRVALSLELNAESVSQAVNSYIQHRVHQLGASKGFRSDDLKFAEDHLSHNAHGTFLWVALVCQQLEKSEPWEVRAYLELFPVGLNRLYERMMDLICSPVSSGLYMRILAIICTVFRPITLSELMAIEDLPGDEEMLPKMIMKCGCFLTVRDKVVYFVHQSAKDFLLKQQGALFPAGLPRHHLDLFHKSLKGLEILKMDIYDLVHPSVSVEEALLNRPEPDPLSGLAYFCQFWAHHLRDALLAPAQDASHCNATHQFIARKLLFWLEALSLYRNLPAAMVALQILQNLPLSSDTAALVEDSCRFFLYFRPVIEVHPLQIYMSGLLFSPEESLIRRHFEQYSPKYVVAKPQAGKQWRPYLWAFELGRDSYLPSLTFSPNGGSLFVSARFEDSGGLRELSVSDGKMQMCLTCPHLRRMTLSPDLKWYAGVAITEDGMYLQVYHLTSNSLKWTAKLDDRQVRGLKFSPNSQQLAVFFCNEFVLWDVEQRSFQKWTFDISLDYSDFVEIEFSSDGVLVTFFEAFSDAVADILVLQINILTGIQCSISPTWGMTFTPKGTFLAGFPPNSHRLMMCTRDEIWVSDIAKRKGKKEFLIRHFLDDDCYYMGGRNGRYYDKLSYHQIFLLSR